MKEKFEVLFTVTIWEKVDFHIIKTQYYSQLYGNTDPEHHNRYDSKQSMVVMQTFEKEWQSAFL